MLDKLLKNGRIYTMKKEDHHVEALGLKDGMITFTGSNEAADLLESKEVIDLCGHTVLPGMVDAHMHLYAYCQNKTFVDLQPAQSLGDVISLMIKQKDKTPHGKWLKGVNFDQSRFDDKRFPTREDLDKISKEHPIVIKRCCLHAVVANTLAMEMVGLLGNGHGKSYVKESSGLTELASSYSAFIDCDRQGIPNGIVREEATRLFDDVMPDPLTDDTLKRQIMLEVMADMSSKGLTGIHTYAAKIWQYNEDISLYQKLQTEGVLPQRVTVCLDELFDMPEKMDEQKKEAKEFVQMGAYKLFTDGSLGSRSAYLKAPYSDAPEVKGVTVCSQEALNRKVLIAYEKGLQPAIHAIGDAALDMTLTAIEKCLAAVKNKGMTESEINKRLPFRIIHVQMIDDELLERMKKLPLVLDIQPVFLATDLHWIEDRLGPVRMEKAYTWKTLLDEGFIQTGGSDCPVESYDPFMGIHTAVERTDEAGYPKGGFYPKEKLSVFEAISLFTVNPPYATGQEDVLGTLEVGKFADFIVLKDNPFEIEKHLLKDIQVLQTFIAGKCVFCKE